MRSSTVALKSLILTAIIVSVSACSSTPYQTRAVEVPTVTSPTSGVSVLVDVMQGVYLTSKYGLDNHFIQHLKATMVKLLVGTNVMQKDM